MWRTQFSIFNLTTLGLTLLLLHPSFLVVLLPQKSKTKVQPLCTWSQPWKPSQVFFPLGFTELASDHILHVWLFLSLFQAPIKHLILIKHSPPLPGPGRNEGHKETLLSWGLPELVSDHSLFSRNNTNWVSLKLPHSPSHTLCGFCFSTATRYICTQQGPSEQRVMYFFSRGASWFFHSNRALTM